MISLAFFVRYIAAHHAEVAGGTSGKNHTSTTSSAHTTASTVSSIGSSGGGGSVPAVVDVGVDGLYVFSQFDSILNGGNASNHTNNNSSNHTTNNNNTSDSTLGADHDYLSDFLHHTTRNKITTPAQVLLRWSLQNQFITLTQSVSRERLVENYNSLVMAPLTFREMTLLDAIQHLVASPLNVPVYV
jgi:hypothetical protein